LVTIEHNENMCDSENLFEYDFKVTIKKVSTSREEFVKKAVDKFSSIEEFAKWVYDNSSPLDKLFEKIEKWGWYGAWWRNFIISKYDR